MNSPPENAVRAYIGLGSNLDDPLARLRSGVAALKLLDRTQVEMCSSLYRTAPVGMQDQPDF
ncbi:MAG: 2-amino-4-hydroxy-6-hydroxymethyldihydropteridine diphosphokinase, partial [Burkholderiales bacterium]|nr:2-amino-4-hydroxy-6-hydroxymethyldihydropteridine diphosphokinase [Burkholderiales bacterium]